MPEKKSLIETKGFACFALLFGICGLLLMAHHIFSYENILRPFMDYLIENKVIRTLSLQPVQNEAADAEQRQYDKYYRKAVVGD